MLICIYVTDGLVTVGPMRKALCEERCQLYVCCVRFLLQDAELKQ